MNFKKLFGERVRHYRKLSNLSQEKLAELVGMSPNTISYIENGKTNISFAKLPVFSTALNVKTYQFFIDVNCNPDTKRIDKINELLNTANEKQLGIILNFVQDVLDI